MTVEEALQELGETPKEIARTLSTNGCTGYRSSGDECPIARHLSKLGFLDVCVDKFSIAHSVSGITIEVPTTEAAHDFISEFDDGGWPELEVNNVHRKAG